VRPGRLTRRLLLLALACCAPAEPPECRGDLLFGAPNAATGLGSSRCGGSCRCGGGEWSPPTYDATDFAAWRAPVLLDPPAPPASDPYDAPAEAPAGPDVVCAVVLEAEGYRLATYESTGAARAAGARPTHFGRCGLCSPLADLAVYAGTPDLTEPVRACGLAHLGGPPEAHVGCLLALGFTGPCAWIWYYNTRHTRRACAEPCFRTLGDPYHLEDGSLNDCLQCDEEASGPVFQAVAGRTRRNTGLASSMCRPCSEVRPLVHDYRPAR
jgi:hypothetical protein